MTYREARMQAAKQLAQPVLENERRELVPDGSCVRDQPQFLSAA